jgi:DNA (cytosine-5)-methyltransferase 1
MRGFGDYEADNTASAIKARDHKDATDLVVEPPILIDRAAFNQGVNAKYDTHISNDPVVPSLVARGPHAVATEPVLLTMREGKPGGGKGPLLSTDKSLSLRTGNEQTLFAPIGFSHTQGLSAQPSEDAWPTLRTEGNGMGVAIPIHDQATRFAGKRGDKQDGKGNGLGIGNPGDPMNTLTSADRHAVATTMTVRRLTPLECERLMGWPDDWTAGQSDTHRYKQCGNGVASPVAQWIGQQLMELDK